MRRLFPAIAVLAFAVGSWAQEPVARVVIEETAVTVGQPFWIYLEASGGRIEFPQDIAVDGLSVDSNSASTQTFFSLGAGRRVATQRRGYMAVPSRAGKIAVPALALRVDGKNVTTAPVEVIAVEHVEPEGQLSKDDLVFTRAFVDKNDVFQGEPVRFTRQLWRIRHNLIESGTPRNADLRDPVVEGFYEVELEPAASVETEKGIQYDVTALNSVLYPAATGDLTIGSWHWEGIAKVYNQGRRRSLFASPDVYEYVLDSAPIAVHVKPLPDQPEGFSGAVGVYTLATALSSESLLQGVPFKLTIVIEGTGNPDAIGALGLPDMSEWAHVSEPEAKVERSIAPNGTEVRVSKSFEYTVTPLAEGAVTIPAVEFLYFDPQSQQYVTASSGAKALTIRKSAESQSTMIVSEGLSLEEGSVEIVNQDIRPLMARPPRLASPGRAGAWVPVAAAVPVVAYVLVFVYALRRDRFANDSGFARAYRARAKATKRLAAIGGSGGNPDALFHALSDFVADLYNADAGGLTSADVDTILASHGVGAELRDNFRKILRSCERAQYASQQFSPDELRALASGAEACIQQLDSLRKEAAS